MNFYQSLKLHYYTYRLFYFIFWCLNFATIGAAIIIFKNSEQLIYRLIIGGLTASLIFTLLLGIYEYQLMYPRYLNLSNIKKDFFWGSLLYIFIHSLLQLGYMILLLIFINSISKSQISFSYNQWPTYLIVIGLHLLIFGIGCILILLLRR